MSWTLAVAAAHRWAEVRGIRMTHVIPIPL